MNRLVIATPLYGKVESASVSYGYHAAASRLLRDPSVDFLEGRIFMNCDLVRARSRAVRMFLEGAGTHLLFWDDDVVPHDMNVVRAMLNCGKDVVAVPYPRKKIDWEKMADMVRDETEQTEQGRQSGSDLEGNGLEWPLRKLDDRPVDGILRVSECGLGFTMISRAAAEKMVAAHPELMFRDKIDGAIFPTVAIFQLMIDPSNQDLLGEDYSFCRRWRDLGGEVWMILDPAAHIGAHSFGGSLHR